MKFNFEATGVGSVPFTDPKKSCDIILGRFKEAPFWPQLPKRSFLESMYVQFSEGFPGIKLDEKRRAISVDSKEALSGMEALYSKYIEGDVGYFSVSRERAAGFYEFLERVKAGRGRYKFLKGQIVGPASFALSLTDEGKRSVIYNTELFEGVVKLLEMKARWQIARLRETGFDNIIIFMDEPYLVSVGSSYVNIDLDKTFGAIDEVACAIRKEGALAGLHCCGNTDWRMILERKIDILNFDAYTFMKEFFLYKADIAKFLARGGTVAWGAVPTNLPPGKKLSERDVVDTLKTCAERVSGIFKAASSNMVTSSCGLGTLDEKSALEILDLTLKASSAMRGKE